MVQIVEQTRDEKIKMYLKCTKRELAEMLINCNDIIALQVFQQHPQPISPYQGVTTYYPPCQHDMVLVQNTGSKGGGFLQCKKCGYTPQSTYGYLQT